ncbi:MAG: TorF family putative porin [Maricaulaceae bacterium]|jgi:uncharacterized protein (TIGR02001 family)
MKKLILKSSTVLVAAAAAASVGGAALGQMEDVEVEGNVALVSDYRFRGVSLSDDTMALQGGFDLATDSGFYVGTWASSIEQAAGSELELDLYGGFGGEVDMFNYDVGVLGYFYPGGNDLEYYELYGSVGTTFGIVDAAAGVAYAPEQDNIGNDDNTYWYVTGEAPLGDSAFTLFGSFGLETGAFGDPDGDGDDKYDWSLGVGTSALGLDWALTYIDTSEDDNLVDGVDATAVLSISKAL